MSSNKRFSLTISQRIALLCVVLYMIISVSGFIIILYSLDKYNKSIIDESLGSYNKEIAEELHQVEEKSNAVSNTGLMATFNEYTSKIQCQKHRYFFHLFDARGNISHTPLSPLFKIFPQKFTLDIKHNTLKIIGSVKTLQLKISEIGNVATSRRLDGTNCYYVLTPYKSKTEELFFIISLYNTSDEIEFRNKVVNTLLFINIVAIALLLFFSNELAKIALIPLRQLTKEAKSIDFISNKRTLFVPNTNDEIQALTISLNTMLHNIDQSYEKSKRFTQDASHELRIPLTVILGNIELMEKFKDDADICQASLHDIKEETLKMKDMVNSLLTISRLEKNAEMIQTETIDIRSLLSGLSNEVSNLTGRTIEVHCKKGIVINSSQKLLLQCLRALLDNALKYSKQEIIIG